MSWKQMIVLWVVGLLLGNVVSAQESQAPPNIVVIMADDLGWRDLACFGSEFYETPNIDQLSSEGITFTDAYASAPLCSATRAALLTGWAPARQHLTATTPETRSNPEFNYTSWTDPAVMIYGRPWPVSIPRQQEQLPLSSITIAERLKEAGYATGFFGKWHLGPDDDKKASDQGFDVAMADYDLGYPRSYFSPYNNPKLTDGPNGEHLTDRLAAEACNFISNSVTAGTPFFCYVPTFAPHSPFQAKQEYIDYFTGTRDEANPQNYAVYAGMIKSLDDAVGTIVAELKAQGVYENTVIIFTSDNGGVRMDKPEKTDGNIVVTSMRPLRGRKATTYEGGIRVPTIIRWPGVASRVSDEVIVTHDIYPTLLDVAGLDPLPGNPLDGINLKPYISQQTPTGREAVTWFYPHYVLVGTPEFNRSNAVIRKGNWKLRHFLDGTDNPAQPWANELYDLDADIGETTNLADQYPEKVAELEALLMAELSAQNAHFPVVNSVNYDEARWFTYWDEQKALNEYLWSTQQGTPLMWLTDYEIVNGFDWHAADWRDINGVPAWQVYNNGSMPVPFRLERIPGPFDFRHPVRVGYRYVLMSSETLIDSNWQEVSAATASFNGFMNVSPPIGGVPKMFYRVAETLEGGQTATTIYGDDFNGLSSAQLGGTTPDTSPGGTWFNGDGSSNTSSFRADGSVVAGSAASGIWLPVSIEAGNVYTLSADVDLTAGNWLTMGFAQYSGDGAFFGAGGYGTFQLNETFVKAFTGVGINGDAGAFGGAFGVTSGVNQLTIVLDASDADSANWTMEFIANGSTLVTAVAADTGDYGDIARIGFTTGQGAVTGTISNFELTVE